MLSGRSSKFARLGRAGLIGNLANDQHTIRRDAFRRHPWRGCRSEHIKEARRIGAIKRQTKAIARRTGRDLERLRKLAVEFLRYDAKQIRKLVKAGAWIEVECNASQA